MAKPFQNLLVCPDAHKAARPSRDENLLRNLWFMRGAETCHSGPTLFPAP
jgi:hypothetical protein